MNFLEIINKCLLELNYRQVNSFSELIKNDHKKIMTILNIINREICAATNWNFLLRKSELTLPARQTEIKNNINGRILYLLIDNKKYNYTQDIESFLTGKAKEFTYSEYADKLLLPKFSQTKTVQIIYYTKNCVIDENGNEKEEMTNPTDCTLIPEPFAQQLLTYGTCLRMKANPSYVRFNYWMSMYKEALINLRSKLSVNSQNFPQVKLYRQ